MDITAQSFPYHLPRILDDLASCCFVALDFEFSGISKTPVSLSSGTQTLQERYDEIKRAAEKYQILQVGLTICHEDAATATYTLKPYNLYLNPIIDQRLEVDRDWSFQGSAIEFLLDNNFQMDALYQNGVTYLSREEKDLAMAKARERRDRSGTRTFLNVKETDYDSLQFLQVVRRMIGDWLALGDVSDYYLNIPPPAGTGVSEASSTLPSILNSFQKRLVHELIEVEYPSLVSIGKPSFVQIITYDENREKAIKNARVRRVQERAWKETGFGWVAEALAGGDLSGLEPGCFIEIMSNATSVEPKYSLKEFAKRLKQKLKDHRPVLVGHNLFIDLVYFCSCFFGPLPNSVEDFQAMVHKLFPMLMDTKYMATYDCGSINPRSSLSEINNDLARVAIPKINIHPLHSKYDTQNIAHEAGYDSLLTAEVFVKLSAQLCDEGISKKSEESFLAPALGPNTKYSPFEGVPEQTSPSRAPSRNPKTRYPNANNASTTNMQSPIQRSREERQKLNEYRTGFDVLEVQELGEIPQDTPEETKSSLRNDGSGEIASKVQSGELIPRLDTEFWKVYGNRLRVFGTEEREFIIESKPASQPTTCHGERS